MEGKVDKMKMVDRMVSADVYKSMLIILKFFEDPRY